MNSDILTRAKLHSVDLFWMVALLSVSPLLYIHGTHLWQRPHFQFFPIAWLSFVYLIYSRSTVSDTTNGWRKSISFVLLILAFIIESLAVWYLSPWLASVGAILIIFGWGLARLGSVTWPRLFSWTMLLWVTVPLPMNMDSTLIQKLQWISASSASEFLDFAGMPHLRLGNTIEVQGKRLLVDEACSGVDSLYSLFAVSILIMNWQARPFLVVSNFCISF